MSGINHRSWKNKSHSGSNFALALSPHNYQILSKDIIYTKSSIMNFRFPTVLQTLLVLYLRNSFDPVAVHAHKGGLRKAQEHAEHSNPSDPITESYPDLFYGNLENAVDEGEDEHRYIVVFKQGSALYKNRVDNARRKLTSEMLDDKFIIRENAEVMILYSDEEVSKMENNEEVEYVEKGKHHHIIYLAILCSSYL